MVDGVWPGISCGVSVAVGGVCGVGVAVCTHMEAVSHATRLAMVQESADPWRTPQRNCVMAVPNGVVVVIRRLLRDSAIHSMYPEGGKPSKWSGRSWSSGERRSKYFSLSSSNCARKALLWRRASWTASI